MPFTALTRRLLCLLLPALLASCATTASDDALPTAPAMAAATQTGWWRASFAIAWPDKEEPAWHRDVLLAHRVVAPVLRQFKPAIGYWRFHRRAARDPTGHRFGFIFYAKASDAAQIFQAIQAQPVLAELLADGSLLSVDYSDLRNNKSPRLEDGADPSWPAMVQKTWPSFIMGASAMWLGLIDEIVAAQARENADLGQEQLYQNVQAQLSELWRDQGQHPFLHHLNALFGYQEMLVIDMKGQTMRF